MNAVLRFSLMTASLCCAAALVELSCRGYLLAFPPPQEPSREERIASPLPPYRGSDYYSAEFLRELDTYPHITISPDGEYATVADVSGRFINVSGGIRVTTDQPLDPARRLFVFGGSAIYSHEVPDRYTIPSFIQRSVNASCPERIAVFNYGVPGMTATEQVARLKTITVHNGDVVVFVDGFNDVFPTVLAGTLGVDPEGADRAQGIGDRAAALGGWIHDTADRWRHASAVAEVVASVGDWTAREPISDAEMLNSLLVARADYRRALLAAQQQVDAAGARFFHFLQPHLFTTALTTTYRQQLADDATSVMDRAFQTAYSLLAQAIAETGQQGVRSVDLSGVFDRDAPSDEVFLDYIHVNHRGNEIIATAMMKDLGLALGCRTVTD